MQSLYDKFKAYEIFRNNHLQFTFIQSIICRQKFDKDLKKVSKDNAFINSKEEAYSINEIPYKQNIILVICSHGSGPDHKIEKCLKSWNLPPTIITNLNNKEIKGYKVKIYRLCSGVRGWTENERDKMYDDHKKNEKLSVG